MSIAHGEKLRRFLKVIDLAPEKLGEKIGRSKATVYNWLKKERLDEEAIQLLQEYGINFLDKSLIEKNPLQAFKEETKLIPFYDVDVSAGEVEMFETQERPASYLAAPGFEDCDFGVRVFGHSMYNTYENGCIIACRRIKDKALINYGACYLIVTEDYRMIKRILKNDAPGAILAVSDNEETRKDGKRKYESFEIPFDKIHRLYLVKGKINREQI